MLLIASANTAQAQDGIGLGFGYLYGGYGGFNNLTYRAYNGTPPYFSLYPPVYYGQRYTRPYGVSPFASWPQLQPNPSYAPSPHADRWTPAPCCIENPYFQAEKVTGAEEVRAVTPKPAEPLIIDNPYFNPAIQYTTVGE